MVIMKPLKYLLKTLMILNLMLINSHSGSKPANKCTFRLVNKRISEACNLGNLELKSIKKVRTKNKKVMIILQKLIERLKPPQKFRVTEMKAGGIGSQSQNNFIKQMLQIMSKGKWLKCNRNKERLKMSWIK